MREIKFLETIEETKAPQTLRHFRQVDVTDVQTWQPVRVKHPG
jgi:hypothetical protein